MFSKVFMAVLAQSLSVSAAVHQVAVGANNQLTFTPNTVQAAVGDTVQFNFMTANHSVVSAASANSPCTPGAAPGAGQIFSQFQPVTAGKAKPQFNVQVTSANATYIYCSQTKGSHCQNAMVMIINPPNANAINTLKQKAQSSGTSTSPNTGLTGGTIVNNAAGTQASPSAKASASAKAKAGTAGAKAAAGKAN